MSARSTLWYRPWFFVVVSMFLCGCSSLHPQRGEAHTAPSIPVVKTKLIEIPATCPPPVSCPTPVIPAVKSPTPKQCKPKIVYQPVKVEDKLVIGEVEMLTLPGIYDSPIRARIDTGAETSSLHVSGSRIFERDGERWVAFTVPLEDGTEMALERPLIRSVLIKQKNSQESMRRPVIMMKVRLGSLERIIEINLADREGFEFPALIGRNFLKDIAIVDVGHTFLGTTPVTVAAQ